MNERKTKLKGFTLIELLIVIAIIAILATIVIINVMGARQKANDSRVLQNLQAAQKAIIQCANEEGTVNITAATPPTADTPVCYTAGTTTMHPTVRVTWPNIDVQGSSGTNWGYTTTVGVYTPSTGVFSFRVNSGAAYILCRQIGCTKSGF